MPQSVTGISHTTTSADRWVPIKTEPLHLTKRRTRTARPLAEQRSQRSSSSHVNGNINGTSFTIQRPPPAPSPLFDPDDPAFSGDPFQHPDHGGPSLTTSVRDLDVGRGDLSSVGHNWEIGAEEPPPAYEDSIQALSNDAQSEAQDEASSSRIDDSSEDVLGSSHIREIAQTSYSSVSTPFSSTSNLPQPQQHHEDDEREENLLLAYLDNEQDETDGVLERDIPTSLRPHRGASVATGQIAASLARSTTLSATRTASGPLARANTERPHLPANSNSMPRRTPENLDRIDELDESVLLGVPLHHRGPYDLQRKVDSPPPMLPPVVPRDRQFQPHPKQHFLIATTSSNAPPPPIPFKLNLKPGEILTRVPPPRSQTTAEHNLLSTMRSYSPRAAEQSTHERSRPQHQMDPHYVHRNNQQDEWSPERHYQDYAFLPPVTPKDNFGHPHQIDLRSNGLSPASTSRSDVQPILRTETRQEEGRFAPQRQVTFQQPVPQPSLSRSISQPVQPASASTYSDSTTSLSRAPPSASDRFRPKRIILPAPLQPQNQSQNQNGSSSYTLPSELMRRTGQDEGTAQPSQPAAAVIPVHDPKKSNMLKKRASTGTSTHQGHRHLLPERSASTKGFLGLGGIFGKSIPSESAPILPKANRKLSKRIK